MGKEVFQENYLRTFQGFSLIQTLNRFFVQSLSAMDCSGQDAIGLSQDR